MAKIAWIRDFTLDKGSLAIMAYYRFVCAHKKDNHPIRIITFKMSFEHEEIDCLVSYLRDIHSWLHTSREGTNDPN
jgi:hypothetical protein